MRLNERLRQEVVRLSARREAVGDGEVIVRRDVQAQMARAAEARGLERAAQMAQDHRCGDEDDIVCGGRNCLLCVEGQIRAAASKLKEGKPVPPPPPPVRPSAGMLCGNFSAAEIKEGMRRAKEDGRG